MNRIVIAAAALLVGVSLLSGTASACVGVSNFFIDSDGPLTAGVFEYGQIAFACIGDQCHGVYDKPCGIPTDP